jgi:UDP-N-acetylglucosamine 2-epimerase (non-hydrolysing)
MKAMVVVGARPNFMKAAPILKAAIRHNQASGSIPGRSQRQNIECVLVHTGQHYDARMSDAFFSDLELPQPDVFLGVGSGSHAVQTAEIMRRFEPVLLQHEPDVVLVAGDVNSTVACALVAAKIQYASGGRPVIAHVESGLRSFDRGMPEEMNRIMTDHLSDILFVTEESGLRNLEKEGIPWERVFWVGNTMIDSLLASCSKADASLSLEKLALRSGRSGQVRAYALLTLHRPANVDQADKLQEILEGLGELKRQMPVIFPAHPRTQKRIEENGLRAYFQGEAAEWTSQTSGILITDPQGYLDFLCLMKNARIVVTDSGGIQEETTGLGVPCVTVRENTERPVTIDEGTNILAGVRREGIRQAIRQQMEGPRTKKPTVPKYWDGRSAERIVEILAQQVPAHRWAGRSAAS